MGFFMALRGGWRAGVLGCCGLLAACHSGPDYRSKSSQSIYFTPPSADSSDHYVVQRGDTLYSIAFRLDMNFKSLARLNHIDPPYRIYAGQRLLTGKSGVAREASETSPAAVSPPVKPFQAPVATMPLRSAANSAAPASPPTVSAALPATATPPESPSSSVSAVHDGSAADDNHAVEAWRWPLSGRIARDFQEGGNKGIDIAAREGDAVAVAAGGKVVYSGQGLIGYGNLIIVKHNDKYLSAYGNNSRLLVKEGDEVAAGQVVAEVGQINNREPVLHFEIRQAGKPVNPLDYLPKR